MRSSKKEITRRDFAVKRTQLIFRFLLDNCLKLSLKICNFLQFPIQKDETFSIKLSVAFHSQLSLNIYNSSPKTFTRNQCRQLNVRKHTNYFTLLDNNTTATIIIIRWYATSMKWLKTLRHSSQCDCRSP